MRRERAPTHGLVLPVCVRQEKRPRRTRSGARLRVTRPRKTRTPGSSRSTPPSPSSSAPLLDLVVHGADGTAAPDGQNAWTRWTGSPPATIQVCDPHHAVAYPSPSTYLLRSAAQRSPSCHPAHAVHMPFRRRPHLPAGSPAPAHTLREQTRSSSAKWRSSAMLQHAWTTRD